MNCNKDDITKNLKEYQSLIHKVLRDFGITTDYEDLHQELMLSTWEVLSDKNPKSRYLKGTKAKFSTFLYTTLQHRLIDIYRVRYKTRLKNVLKRDQVKNTTKRKVKIIISRVRIFNPDGKLVIDERGNDRCAALAKRFKNKKNKLFKGFRILKNVDIEKEPIEKFDIEETIRRDLAHPMGISELTYEQQLNALKDDSTAKGIRIDTDIEGFKLTLSGVNLRIWELMLESWNQQNIVRILKEEGITKLNQSTVSRKLKELRIKFKLYTTEGD